MIYLSNRIYYKNSLWVEDVNIAQIKENTPYYCYTYQGIVDNYQKVSRCMPGVLICYAVKANPNISIIRTLAKQGAGADVVSEGEMRKALVAGTSKIIFSGVGKTAREIEFALKNNIYQINVESISELKLINHIANTLQVNASIGIRVNLDVEGETHDKISTCRRQDKFGVGTEELGEVLSNNKGIVGLSIHIGSQISKLNVFKQAFYKLKNVLENFETNNIVRLDLGGGFSIPYKDEDEVFDYVSYYQLIHTLFNGYQIIIEPGRALIGNTGILVSKVLFVKRNEYNTHVVIDAAMNDLMRPALYGAQHEIIPIRCCGDKSEIVDIVGPICESGDTFAKQREMPTLKEGDLVGVCTAGAYGASMSNNYNSRLLIPEFMVKGNEYFIIRKRESYDELLARELTTDFNC